MPAITKKQMEEYEKLKRDRDNGRLLTPDGLRFIDVEDMYGYRPVSLIREIQCPYCGEVLEIDLEDGQMQIVGIKIENTVATDKAPHHCDLLPL